VLASNGPVGPGIVSPDMVAAVPELEVVLVVLVHAASAVRDIATTSRYARLPIFVDRRNSIIAPSYTWYAA